MGRQLCSTVCVGMAPTLTVLVFLGLKTATQPSRSCGKWMRVPIRKH